MTDDAVREEVEHLRRENAALRSKLARLAEMLAEHRKSVEEYQKAAEELVEEDEAHPNAADWRDYLGGASAPEQEEGR